MKNDIRFALRMIASHPWFSGTVIATLAVCIGINTTVFTLVSAALLKPVPVPRGELLVAVSEKDPKNPRNRIGVSFPEYREYRGQTKALSALEAALVESKVVSEKGNPPERYGGAAVSQGLFEMLRTPPVLGRAFTAADCQPGAAPVALIGYRVWQRRYGGAPDVLGRSARIDGVETTIIGVMPNGFRFPGVQDIWTPLAATKDRQDRSLRNLMVFGMLSPGARMADAQSDLDVISARMARQYPDTEKDLAVQVQTFHEAFNGGPIRLIFLLALGAVGIVLLIACANIANMMLSRSLARGREIAVRAALGASRWQIIRQLLVESVSLSALGGVCGLLLAQFGIRAFDLAVQSDTVGKPYWVQFTMDWRVFAYFTAISLATGLAFGIVPAWRASRVDLNTALKDGAQSGGNPAGRLAGALVVFQFALTVVLLAGAGIMVRSFLAAAHINPFIPAEHILTARISLPDGKGERYESVDARRRMHERLLERLRSLPGVAVAALASDMPGLGAQDRAIEIEGRPAADPKRPPRALAVFASPNYLSAIGLPIMLGRALDAGDGAEGKEAAVVTRAFAARYWPASSPLGQRFRFMADGKPGAWITIVGVCGNLIQETFEQNPPPLAYLSDRQEPWAWLGILLRARGDPVALASSLRSAMQELDPDVPVFEVATLPAAIENGHWFLEVFGTLFLVFALVALLMASVGVYAVVAQTTLRRTREIGIRIALGASAGRVVQLVLARGFLQLGAGLAIGLACAIAAARLLASIPGMTSSGDPAVFGAVAGLLLLVGLFACWLPARRAARIAPTEALRVE